MSETVTLVTCKDRAEAMTIAAKLVEERLAACVSIVPGATSVFAWKGKVETVQEILLVIKSRKALARKLAARVKQLHSYETPEVISLPVVAGDPAYRKWVRESTR